MNGNYDDNLYGFVPQNLSEVLSEEEMGEKMKLGLYLKEIESGINNNNYISVFMLLRTVTHLITIFSDKYDAHWKENLKNLGSPNKETHKFYKGWLNENIGSDIKKYMKVSSKLFVHGLVVNITKEQKEIIIKGFGILKNAVELYVDLDPDKFTNNSGEYI